MVDFGNDSDESDSLSSDSDNEEGPNTMMSLLSSYYGVEDDTAAESATPKAKVTSDIDAIGFDHNEYVRKKFASCEVNDLMREDTKLIHDIKTLDSDMQMLVYENYNKFISATETIKRMKTNVEAMDDDMNAVTSKMECIITTTTRLDSTLTAKRSHIDKLVRIKRLLTRLEFLSELPERLESMIEQEMYKQAIQLYNKTITVLTKQENVLSFKKIKLKTESMMNDLRLKVLSLMDSNSLEAQQLTQYVGILKLMECSRDIVMEKFLAAHKRRSIHMIKQFQQESKAMSSSEGGEEAKAGSENVLSVTTVRNFHQSVMVGLIESSNGVSEMFQPKDAVSQGQGIVADTVINKNTTADANTMTLSMAYDELQGMIGIVMPEYIHCMTTSITSFFKRYDAAFTAHQKSIADIEQKELLNQMKNDLTQHDTIAEENEEEELDTSEEKIEDTKTQNDAEEAQLAQIRLTFKQVNEERLQWIALTRQVILDCQYLDSGTEHVRPAECDASLPHADSVAEAVLGILDEHFNTLFAGHMEVFKNEVTKVIPTFVKYANVAAELKKEVDNPESPSCRSLFPQRLFQAQSTLDDLSVKFDAIFEKVCDDSRAIYETHAVSRVGKSNLSGELMLRYCNHVARIVESLGGVSIRPAGSSDIFEESLNTSAVSALLDYDSTSSTNSVRSAKSAQLYNGHCCYDFTMTPETASQATACLLSAVMFSTVLPTLTDRLEEIMKKTQICTRVSSGIQDQCVKRLEDSCLIQLEAFIAYHADCLSDDLTSALRDALLVDEQARDTVITIRDLSVTSATLSCAQSIDHLTLLSCCLLLENLPAPQIRSSQQSAGDIRGPGGKQGSAAVCAVATRHHWPPRITPHA